MRLFYFTNEGVEQSIQLGGKPVTIGRSAEADVMLLDEQASRVHCNVRLWEGAYYIKDLKSKNGTFVNDQAIELHALSPGERIRVGQSVFIFDHDQVGPDTTTALRKMQDQMDQGKGYSTILREIVDQTSSPPRADEDAEPGTGQGGGTADEPEAPSDDERRAPTNVSPAKRKIVAGKKKVAAKGKISSKRPPLKVKIRKPKQND